jgi:hypothetical protein
MNCPIFLDQLYRARSIARNEGFPNSDFPAPEIPDRAPI